MAILNLRTKRNLEKYAFSYPVMKNMALRWVNSKNGLMFSDYGDHSFVYDPSEFIGRTLFEKGVFQRRNIEIVIEKCLSSGAMGDGGVFVEIGANIGTHTVYANLTHRFDRIIAVEPDPVNLTALRANIRLNGFEDRATVVPVGISDQKGELILRRNSLHSGMSTLEPPLPGVVAPEQLGEVAIEVLTGDEMLEKQGVAPTDVALIWMDVEGHEPKALRGMAETLAALPPLFFEFTPSRMTPEEMDWIETEVLDKYSKLYCFTDKLTELDAAGRRDIRTIPDKLDILALK